MKQYEPLPLLMGRLTARTPPGQVQDLVRPLPVPPALTQTLTLALTLDWFYWFSFTSNVSFLLLLLCRLVFLRWRVT